MKAGRSRAVIVEIDGKSMSLWEVASASGNCYQTVYHRYRRGVRGAALMAPGSKKAGIVGRLLNDGQRADLLAWAHTLFEAKKLPTISEQAKRLGVSVSALSRWMETVKP